MYSESEIGFIMLAGFGLPMAAFVPINSGYSVTFVLFVSAPTVLRVRGEARHGSYLRVLLWFFMLGKSGIKA